MGFAITQTAPAIEPVDVATAKRNSRVDVDDEDSLFVGWIAAARELAEEFTRRLFISRSCVLTMDRFPPFDLTDPSGWYYWMNPGYPDPSLGVSSPMWRAIRLPFWPVVSVEAVKYYSSAGVQTTLTANTDYLTNLNHMPALVYPYPGRFWPVTQYARLATVEVDFTAGYGTDPSAVPPLVKQAILLTVEYWSQNRGGDEGDAAGFDVTQMGMSRGALRLLNQYLRVGYC